MPTVITTAKQSYCVNIPKAVAIALRWDFGTELYFEPVGLGLFMTKHKSNGASRKVFKNTVNSYCVTIPKQLAIQFRMTQRANLDFEIVNGGAIMTRSNAKEAITSRKRRKL